MFMRKIVLALMVALALTSCANILAYWAPKHRYTLTAEDRSAIAFVFGDAYVSTIQKIIYTKDLPYGAGYPGIYSINSNEIWMNENASIKPWYIAHEVTHYYQANVLHQSLGASNQDRRVPDEVSSKLGTEQEACLVQLYVYFRNKITPVLLDGYTYSPNQDAYETYIKTYLLHILP
jgi:uncharacterized protein YceK